MQNLKKYRIVAWILVTVFFVFNVGVPIVLASCPMTQEEKSLACCAPPQATSATINSNEDFSCCNTVVAAERNTTEFLHDKDNSFSITQYSITPTLHQSIVEISSVPQTFFVSSYSPPRTADIPVFISSLLI